ncbi:MAG TPA: hypothetical protein VHZ32_16790 [Rhizomicrobium sp.]|nr:hypothetical protein [Rhizomicrobium sp.]
MFRIMHRKGLAFALSVALNLPGIAIAAENPTADASDYDARLRDLDTQMRNVLNTPTDFCDGPAMFEQQVAYTTLLGKKFQLQRERETVHPTIRQSVQKVVQTAADEGELAEEMPIVDDYEAAMKRGDAAAADALVKKMTPWEQVRAAQTQHNYALVFGLLTPMADRGEVKAQSYLAALYNPQTDYYVPPSFKWPASLPPLPPPPPRDGALAFKYARMAAANGDVVAEQVLAKTYACGLGTPRDPVKAYAWFSLAVSQSALMLDTDGRPEDLLRKRAFIAASMSHDDVQRAKHLIIRCHASGYKDCD